MKTKVIEAVVPAVPKSVRVARELAEEVRELLPAETIDNLKLLISEVVTNSIKHAGLALDENVQVKITVGGNIVRTEVTDSGGGFIHSSRLPEDLGPSGWGLEVVDRLSSRWGVTSEPQTKVWFEIDVTTIIERSPRTDRHRKVKGPRGIGPGIRK